MRGTTDKLNPMVVNGGGIANWENTNDEEKTKDARVLSVRALQ